MRDEFSKYLTGFRKNHNTHHALINLIEDWKSNLNKENKLEAIFMNLFKAFYNLDHSLLIAKNLRHMVSIVYLRIEILPNRKQRCKVGNCFSLWRRITSGVL